MVRGEMEVDIPDVALEDSLPSQQTETQATKLEEKKPIVVEVDDSHPFDVESYISAYSGLSL